VKEVNCKKVENLINQKLSKSIDYRTHLEVLFALLDFDTFHP
jgi:hypothetical protein